MTRGKVYLVGAGPGDPKLLTLKGKECLEEADVIFYDSLVNPDILDFSKTGTEKIFVGKKGDGSFQQAEINARVIQKAMEGKTVVRLKGGDPFIFGRGGEEAEALVEEGLPFEVVPGITSAIAVPAYAGIPLTHRGLSSSVAFITAHEDPSKLESSIDWSRISTGIGTLVFFMGLGNLKTIVKQLIKNGRSPDTPIALIRWGTRYDQKSVIGTLSNILKKSDENELEPPVLILVGEVIQLREKLNWFEKRPLFGKKILITRSKEQSKDFSDLLFYYGAEPVIFPTISLVPPESWEEMDLAIRSLEKYDWILFSSVNGVHFFMSRLKVLGKDIRVLHRIKICAVGSSTAEDLLKYGIQCDLVPASFQGESVVEAFQEMDIKGLSFLIPRAKEAREVIPESLRKMGAKVDLVTAYKNIRPHDNIDRIKRLLIDNKIAVLTFTSSSTVKNFLDLFQSRELKNIFNNTKIASIGPITSQTLREAGFAVDIQPQEHTIKALTDAILEYYK
ncbi:MAG: uroporphyrinogen-III C-methyltransferase [Nitrospirae bacterium]|nr:uroporphyrinogen-III C-methyltransferase [Nitrospirota bacterium]MBI3594893.1 uroporphyrinogen-III C-methyltransferase [Nitrospirota bacterium]